MELTAKRKALWLAFFAVDALLALFLVYLFLVRAEMNEIEELRELGTTVYQEPFPLHEFSLTDNQGNEFGLGDLRGNWSLVFFGFTSCPNICPLTMFELEKFYRELESLDNNISVPKVILATVDPATDTPAVLTEYLAGFHEDFIGLTGDLDALAELADQLFVARSESSESTMNTGHEDMSHGAGSIDPDSIDHSAHISLINPAGQLLAVMRIPHRGEAILQAYQQITQK